MPDPLQHAMINTAPGDEYADDTRLFQGIPGIGRAPNGRLWATWYAGGAGEGPENYVVLVTSADDGRTWSAARLVIDPEGDVRAFDPCLWRDPEGRLWLFWAQSISWFDGRGGVWGITTENPDQESPEWSAPRRLCHGVMMNKPTVLSSGEWLLPAALWHRNRESYPDLDGVRRSNVVQSADEGASFELLGGAVTPEDDRAWDEHMTVERRDGSLWMLVRTKYGIGESFSSDRGETWTQVEPSSLAHPSSRFFIRRLQSGNLLLIKHGPVASVTPARSHLTAYLSEDDGASWRGGLLIDERDGVSYPDGVQSPDGTIYIIYDYSRTEAREILMASFTEQHVMGDGDPDGLRLRVLVNKATGQAPATE